MARRRKRKTSPDDSPPTADERPTAGSASAEQDEREAFGPWLRRQREGREIELREIAEASKISLRYLQALEQGQFEVLPAPVFTKGFLRQYARYIGLDPEEVINAYLAARQFQDDVEEPRFDPPARGRSRGARNLRYLLVVLVVAALLLGIVWLLGVLRGQSTTAADGDAARVDSAAGVGASDTARREPSGPTRSTTVPAGDTTTLAASVPGGDRSLGDRSLSDEALGSDLTATQDGPGNAASSTADTGSADASTVAAGLTAPLRIVLDFRSDCWIEANLDGERRLAELHIQGESLRLDASRWIELKVGDHNAVRVLVNGDPFDLAALGDGRGAVRAVRIDAPATDAPEGATR
ncbi:MAG: RodZ domain-containing protein [Acidobacteriota bacterium]